MALEKVNRSILPRSSWKETKTAFLIEIILIYALILAVDVAVNRQGAFREDARITLRQRIVTYIPSRNAWIIIASITFFIASFFDCILADYVKPNSELISTFALAIIAIFTVLVAAFLGVYGILVPLTQVRAERRRAALQARVNAEQFPSVRSTAEEAELVEQASPPKPTRLIMNALRRLRRQIIGLTTLVILLALIMVVLMNVLEVYPCWATFFIILTMEYAIIDGLFYYRVLSGVADLFEDRIGEI